MVLAGAHAGLVVLIGQGCYLLFLSLRSVSILERALQLVTPIPFHNSFARRAHRSLFVVVYFIIFCKMMGSSLIISSEGTRTDFL